ncbi:glycosyl-4,4'-diaponeurosporenoate acyltransferase [Halobacillus litoralis]|uniref:glycosyl-4,4'-diaponeurosporenoate acyltransferase CrtO family protein n=1 Tax=Halobacillus litoralis TaxID=45668 RepID=UPI001CFE1785|nr:glycosyl-4,4'-diaponeurosporenoate acyltransferase [Halobacillus litoralis]WLR47403.1 glycosyl-4,4'-diaponeurosporenoate acyltransferase [Halobacillus litoralis]
MVVNVVAWLCIHLGVSSLVSVVPDAFVNAFAGIYRVKRWESQDKVYERLGVKKWKDRLPEARKWFRREKSAAHLRRSSQWERFEKQTNRSELSHWMQMLAAPFFFLFNPPWAGWIMVAYALLFNLPFIIVQRYNRVRLMRMKGRVLKR